MLDAEICLGVIPARLRSTRFPNKITALIHGKPMIQHVWESAMRAHQLDEVVIATEDESVFRLARGFGAEAVLTPSDFVSGSDRVAYVARQRPDARWVVNLQGDEPMLPAGAVDSLVTALKNDGVGMSTLAVLRESESQLRDPNVVKVLVSAQGEALYFSRHPLASNAGGRFLKHIGIYGFERETLLDLSSREPSDLEKLEKLEQLRALEAGIKIKVIQIAEDTVAVDTPEDLMKVESLMTGEFVSSPVNEALDVEKI